MKLFLSLSAIFLFSFLGQSQYKKIEPYINFINQNKKQTAKQYILEKFKTHDLVILCERDHRDVSQYSLIKEILEDDYFIKHVGNLFTEIGVVNLNPEINETLQTKNLDSLTLHEKLAYFQRNASFWPNWEKYNYQVLLKTIYDINQKSEKQISFYPSDIPFDWSTVKTKEDYIKKLNWKNKNRDSIIASNIINQFTKLNNKKALVIVNDYHAFKKDMPENGKILKAASRFLFDYFGNKAFNIFINNIGVDENGQDVLVQSGKWDATFKFLNIDDIGFDLPNSPFGKDHFDYWSTKNSERYETIFDGFVFYKPIEDFNIVINFEGFVPKEDEGEMLRRLKIDDEVRNRDISRYNDPEFREIVIRKLNTKTEFKIPSLEELIKQRNQYLLP